jgi:hypothetical protein
MEVIKGKQVKNELSEREKKQFLSWDKILEIKDQIFKSNSIKDKMIIALYTLIPPRRTLDYAEMIYVVNEPEQTNKNYLIDNKKMIFNVYKTSNVYKQQIITVPDDLQNIITQYITECKIKPNDLLLGFPSSNGLTVYLSRLISKYNKGIGFSVDILRHSYITSRRNDLFGKCTTVEEMIDFASKMSHSLLQELLYYRKPQAEVNNN